jgi:NADH dehydrogenase
VELRTANVHEKRVLGQLFEDCSAVINLIGILNEHRRDTFARVHTELAAKVISAARGAGVRRVLHMSSLGASEQAPSRYLRSKGAAEAAVRALPHGEQPHPAVTVFRPSVIFGAHDSLTNRFAHLLRMSGGILPLARANARFAPISVLDVAEAFARALTAPASAGATYELCGPEVLTLEQIVRLTARSAHLPCHIFELPDLLARLQGVVMGLLPGKPFSLDNFRSLTVDSVCRENGCAALGIEPRPMLAELPLYLSPTRAQLRPDLHLPE